MTSLREAAPKAFASRRRGKRKRVKMDSVSRVLQLAYSGEIRITKSRGPRNTRMTAITAKRRARRDAPYQPKIACVSMLVGRAVLCPRESCAPPQKARDSRVASRVPDLLLLTF